MFTSVNPWGYNLETAGLLGEKRISNILSFILNIIGVLMVLFENYVNNSGSLIEIVTIVSSIVGVSLFLFNHFKFSKIFSQKSMLATLNYYYTENGNFKTNWYQYKTDKNIERLKKQLGLEKITINSLEDKIKNIKYQI